MKIAAKENKNFPTKKTVNFALKEAKKTNYKVIVPVTFISVIAVILFVKFGIIDLIAAKSTADAGLKSYQSQSKTLEKYNEDYDLISLEYQSFNLAKGKDGKIVNVTPMKSLEMLEKELLSVSHVESFSITTDTITVKYGGIGLNKISNIYNSIKENELVNSVQVYTAGTQPDKNKNTVATMTIILKGAKTTSSKTAASSQGGKS